jgi:hypothetical protein
MEGGKHVIVVGELSPRVARSRKMILNGNIHECSWGEIRGGRRGGEGREETEGAEGERRKEEREEVYHQQTF